MSPDPASADGDLADGALYDCRVMHRRRTAPMYRFVYQLFYLYLDIDTIDRLAARLRWFSHNRFNLLSFHNHDHGDQSDGPLRPFAEKVLRSAGLETGGRIQLLCLPRVLGYAFNPISLWFCDDPRGRPLAVIAEVRNTFGEKHAYLLEAGTGEPNHALVVDKDKCFHVSPFFDLVGRYRFTIEAPNQRLRLLIHEQREGVPIFDATLTGERRGLDDATILKRVLAAPWMTVKVIAAIHWQALKIWVRGGRYHKKPPPPALDIT